MAAQQTVERIAHDLKVLAFLREGDRIYVSDSLVHVMHPSLAGSLWRWSRGDNRTRSVTAVSSVIDDALSLVEFEIARHGRACDAESKAASVDALSRFYREIHRASLGLKNLRATYLGDLSTTASIDVLRERTQTRLTAVAIFLRVRGGFSDEDDMVTFQVVEGSDHQTQQPFDQKASFF